MDSYLFFEREPPQRRPQTPLKMAHLRAGTIYHHGKSCGSMTNSHGSPNLSKSQSTMTKARDPMIRGRMRALFQKFVELGVLYVKIS